VRQTRSRFAGGPYDLAFTCRVLEIPRSTVCATPARELSPTPSRKRDPKTAWSDAELTEHIQEAIRTSLWLGEGHRKVWDWLRKAGMRISKARVLRLVREAELLAPTWSGSPHGPKAHDGTITTDRPDSMWGTDATGGWTDKGNATMFIAVHHCTQEWIGIHAARFGQPLRGPRGVPPGGSEALRRLCGARCRGPHTPPPPRQPEFISRGYQAELDFLGLSSRPADVQEPEGDGVVERFIRTIKEAAAVGRRLATVSELEAIHALKGRYNKTELVQTHRHVIPTTARAALGGDTEVTACNPTCS
jgi:putative transposase